MLRAEISALDAKIIRSCLSFCFREESVGSDSCFIALGVGGWQVPASD